MTSLGRGASGASQRFRMSRADFSPTTSTYRTPNARRAPRNPAHPLLVTTLLFLVAMDPSTTTSLHDAAAAARGLGAAEEEHMEIAPANPHLPWNVLYPYYNAYSWMGGARLPLLVPAGARRGPAPAVAVPPPPPNNNNNDDGAVAVAVERDQQRDAVRTRPLHRPDPPPMSVRDLHRRERADAAEWVGPGPLKWSRPGHVGAPVVYGGTGVSFNTKPVPGGVRVPLVVYNPTRPYARQHGDLWQQNRDPALLPGAGVGGWYRSRRKTNGMLKSVRAFGTGELVDFCVYLLVNDLGGVYTGWTDRNPHERLAEHNKRGRGGNPRRYTRRGNKWFLLYSVHGFPNNGAAKAFEKALKKKSIGSRQIRDAPLKKQVQLLLMLAKAEYRHLVVCGHWMRNSAHKYTRSVPIRQTYTEDTLLAAGFNPSDAKAYSEVREPFPRQ